MQNNRCCDVLARSASLAVTAAMLALGVSAGAAERAATNVKPPNVRTITSVTYNGTDDDLLTAGLGKTGLGAAAAPAAANATSPTAAELRRIAIFNNYRSILDISPKGGYGVLYGPNIDVQGKDTLGEGKI